MLTGARTAASVAVASGAVAAKADVLDPVFSLLKCIYFPQHLPFTCRPVQTTFRKHGNQVTHGLSGAGPHCCHASCDASLTFSGLLLLQDQDKIQFDSLLTLPGDSVRSHRLTAQSHRTAPPTPPHARAHFRCQLKAQVLTCVSNQLAKN